jgi:hypothetical protein
VSAEISEKYTVDRNLASVFFVSNAACASGLVPFLMNLQSIRFVDFCLHKVGIDET